MTGRGGRWTWRAMTERGRRHARSAMTGRVRRWAGRAVTAALLCVGVASATAPLAAQVAEETRLLREAAARESRGDYAGAEAVLLRLMEASPTSSGGLFALERVLRAKGELPAILPVVDTFLARAPDSPGVRYLKLRVLVEGDSLEAVAEEAEAWFGRDRRSLTPYREVARIYAQAFGAERALEVLRRGRREMGDEGALALEMGDLLAEAGDPVGAVEEWSRAVGADGGQAATVARRVSALEEGRTEGGRRLVEILARSPDSARRRAGASIALDLGLEAEATRLAQRVADELDGRPRQSFLADVARRARDRDMVELASWAYSALGEVAGTPGERRQFDQRLVESALAAGDTVAALEAQRRVVRSYTPGSVDRRRAQALAIRLEAGRAPPERLASLVADFQEEFPSAPELDELGAAVAAALLARGDTAGAAEVLSGVDGPRSSLERGYLLMGRGDVALGRQALLMAVPGLNPHDATDVIQLAGLLGRVSPAGVAVLGEAAVLAHRGRGEEGARVVVAAVASVPEADRAPLLAEAARMAERAGADALAAEVRRLLVDRYGESQEAGEAGLALARWLAGSGERDEAVAVLESLITARPNGAVVPDARRELERLRRGRS